MTMPATPMPACKHCQSPNVIKWGTYKGAQRYWCKACKRKFKADDALFKGKVSARDISSALNEYYSGMSINDIRRRIRQESGYYPAQATVYKWVDKFTDKAVKHYDHYKPNVGDVWVADETVLNIDGKDVWMWDIIDEETRFLLASKLSYTRSIEDARTLFELAKRRAGREPKVLLTDKLRAYPEAARQALPDTYHKQSKPFTETDSTNKIERWHSTLKERTKVMRGLKDVNSALAFTDGFLAFYNFIRPHESLGGMTPAEKAGVSYDVKNWAGIIRMGEPAAPGYYGAPDVMAMRQEVRGTPFRPGDKKGSKHLPYDRSGQRATLLRKAEIAREAMLTNPIPDFSTKMPPEVRRLVLGPKPPRGIRL